MFFLGFPVFNRWPATPVYPRQQPLAATTPIAIKPRNSDPGIQLSSRENTVTIKGTTQGAQQVRGALSDYSVARGMSFTLDIDKAPTVDIFGKTDFTEKNSRIFTLDTSPGWSAEKCARLLADKVNRQDDFRALVTMNGDAATIELRRR